MAFWNRRKRNAIDAWKSEVVSTEIVTEPTELVSTHTSVIIDGETLDPSNPQHREALETAEAMLGQDLDGDGRVSPRPPGAVFTVPGGADPISKLERLQKLRESGALTDAEFEEQKRRILDSDAG